MLDLKCRLCSSACTLISLSGGKSRNNRDYIRKLVEITTGIKFKNDDFFKCICYPCTIQVYNFYIFKCRCLENEKVLEAHITRDEKIESNKIEIPTLDNIILPDVDELQNTLAPWLISKLKYCEIINDAEKDVDNTIVNNMCRTVESSTQYDAMFSADVSVQCNLPKNSLYKNNEIDSPCLLLDKYIQCVVPNVTIHTQTNGVLKKSSQIQCCLIKDTREKVNTSTKDCGIQTEKEGIDKTVQHPSICEENCQVMDCKCRIHHNLLNIKQESQVMTPKNLSRINSLDITSSPTKSNLFSPISAESSPLSTSSLTLKLRSRNVIVCKHCHQILYSKLSYNLHKKVHMKCSFCKKRFFSIKSANRHTENDCEIKKMMSVQPVVCLYRLENLKNVQKEYGTSLDDLKIFQMVEKSETRRIGRLRSRSTSSVDSSCSCCSMCRNSVSVLHSLKLGKDKSVQTSFFEGGIGSGLVNGSVTLKAKYKSSEEVMSPAKKIRLVR